MNDIYELDHWVSKDELNTLSAFVSNLQKVEYVGREGKFANQLIATQSWHSWDATDQLGQILGPKMVDLIGEHKVVECNSVELFLPWDIHCDYTREVTGKLPYYSFLIPLESAPSRTILFDQVADYNDFWKYKKVNSHTAHPVDLDFWNKNLSHCWDDDRLYLSLKYVSQDWNAGSVIVFKRELFHSSDNYHLKSNKPKKFLQILTDLE